MNFHSQAIPKASKAAYMLQTEASYILRYALNWATVMICVPVSPPASDSGPQMSERADRKRKL